MQDQKYVKTTTNRVGFVDSDETTSLGRLARKAPRQLIVRGTCKPHGQCQVVI
jgi:hypothetical protein